MEKSDMNDEIEISVIAPCFNEEGNIEELCARMHAALSLLGKPFELICVDDASTDSTRETILAAEKKYDFLKGAFHEVNQGIPGGWATGSKVAKGRLIVTTDADLQYRPEDILPMYERFQKGDVEIVQGWRKSQVKRSAIRRFFTAGFSWILNFAFGMKLSDNKSGFLLMKKDLFIRLMEDKDRFFFFHHFIAVAACARGHKIAELPVTFDERFAGESYIRRPIVFSIKSGLDIPKAIWEYRIKNKPKKLEDE